MLVGVRRGGFKRRDLSLFNGHSKHFHCVTVVFHRFLWNIIRCKEIVEMYLLFWVFLGLWWFVCKVCDGASQGHRTNFCASWQWSCIIRYRIVTYISVTQSYIYSRLVVIKFWKCCKVKKWLTSLILQQEQMKSFENGDIKSISSLILSHIVAASGQLP